jgi:uncharacterized protein GlcG (DUF336 family)
MLTTCEAQIIISAAVAKANAINVAVNIAVLDEGAHLKAFLRMDAAVLGSIDVATRKARTSVLFEVNSEAVWEYCKPGAPAPGLELTNEGLAPFAGGIPLKNSHGFNRRSRCFRRQCRARLRDCQSGCRRSLNSSANESY